jgi:SAM-dependent methyltransferase
MRRYSLLEVAGVAAAVAASVLAATGYWTPDRQAEVQVAPGAPSAVLDEKGRRQAFERIYDRGIWAKDPAGKGTSGAGSTLESTRYYRAYLQEFLAANQIRSVVDAGCGDWEFSQHMDWKGIDYLGLDIVPAVIEANRKRFGSAGVRFAVADIVRDELPAADLLIIKDVLQHLSHGDTVAVLRNLPRYRHVLIVNDVNQNTLTAEPADTVSGGYRLLDVTRPPYSLPGAKALVWRHGSNTKLLVHLRRP